MNPQKNKMGKALLRLCLTLALGAGCLGFCFLVASRSQSLPTFEKRADQDIEKTAEKAEKIKGEMEKTAEDLNKDAEKEIPEVKKMETEVEKATESVEPEVKEEAEKLTREAEGEERKINESLKKHEKAIGMVLEGRTLSPTAAQAAIAHHNLLIENEFPSANQCAECHPLQFREWSVSSHAYAQISPVFNAMHGTVNVLTNGTNGDFCIRCHNQVGMAMKEPYFTANKERSEIAREGITCIVCHRVQESYGRVSGRMGLVKGDIFQPMYGPRDDKILKEVLGKFTVNTKPTDNPDSQDIHSDSIKIKTFASPQLCSMCHDVNSQNHFRLEEAYSQFRNSPAAKEGTTCQDCHMGTVQGIPSPYAEVALAHVAGTPTPAGKHSNHMFGGPDYSIAHPGIFPHNPLADRIATFEQWLEFDVEAGWGTKDYENNLPAGTTFPAAWVDMRHRVVARAFIDQQLELLGEIRAQSFRVLRRGYQLDTFKVTRNDPKGIAFQVQIRNGTNGHGTPTGFDAERLVFLQVTVTDATGKVVFKSGDRDPNGDVRDLHSTYVKDYKVPKDQFLLSLQSRFLLDYLHGGEREEILPVNQSTDPLPFDRPSTNSALLQTYPNGVRKQAWIIPPLGDRWGIYSIDAKQLTGRAPYRVNLKFVAQMVPVNLVNAISDVGFDYGLNQRTVAERVVNSAFLLWDKSLVIPASGQSISLKPTEAEILGHDAVKPALPWLKDATRAK